MASTRIADMTVGLTFDGDRLSFSMKDVSKKAVASAEEIGRKSGRGLGNTFAVAAGSLISKGISKIASLVSGTMDAAISRMDTLNNFPQVMTALGYASEEADSSITAISDHLDGLPTTLDGMVDGVQQLAATMGNLAEGEVNATSVGLALNDMFLAGGKGTQMATVALEQYNKMLAAGKVDAQSWQSVNQAAPGQLDQVAKSMLGASANAQTLYKALQSGEVSMNDLNAAIVRLDKEGGQGFASFNEQAIAGTQGLGTQIANIQTSLTKVVTAALKGDELDKPLKQLGQRVIAVIPTIVSGFSKAASALATVIPEILPPLIQALIDAAPAILDGILQLVQALLPMIPQLLPQITQAIIELVKLITAPQNLQLILQAFVTLLREFTKAIPIILDQLVAALPTIIDNIVSFLTDPENIMMILGAAVELFGALIAAVPKILGGLLGAFGTLVGRLWEGIKQMFGAFASKFGEFLGGIFRGAINKVLEFIEGFINTPINLINGFIDAINGAFGWIGVDIGKIDLIHLPRMAQGGIATGASAAVIGEAGTEAVLPLERNTDNWSGLLAQALAEEMEEQELGGGREIVVNMTNNIDNRLDAEEIGRIMVQSIRRQAL